MRSIPRPIPGWKPSTPAVTGRELSVLTQRYPAVAVHFWAEWDAHDVAMDERVQAVADQFRGRVHFVSCDVDLPENRELCERAQVVNVPLLQVFVGSRACQAIVGVRSAEDLALEIEKRLREPSDRRPWWAFWSKASDSLAARP
jgi:thiol-disulfide isomerase/thioredoxin